VTRLVFTPARWYKNVYRSTSDMTIQRSAPVYLNLIRIHFPVGAVTSIAHRVSGVLMFLSIPLLVYLLDLSLQGPAEFAIVTGYLQATWIRLGSVLLAWSLFHHLLSGIRFLLLDIAAGIELRRARFSAWLVNLLALLLALAYLWWIL
jgi:succinate dehydrogenase / fumarate reductase cytochrome b subunit